MNKRPERPENRFNFESNILKPFDEAFGYVLSQFTAEEINTITQNPEYISVVVASRIWSELKKTTKNDKIQRKRNSR